MKAKKQLKSTRVALYMRGAVPSAPIGQAMPFPTGTTLNQYEKFHDRA